jgi:hypothetical protein
MESPPERVEPFGFFTREAAESGGVLSWELLRDVVGLPGVLVAVAGWLSRRGPALALVSLLLLLAALAALITLARRNLGPIANRWATRYYGRPLPDGAKVWWEVTWRSTVAGFVASVVLTPPTLIATSLQVAFAGSILGALGHVLLFLIFVANVGVSVVASGWAMSRAVLRQLPLTDVPAAGAAAAPLPPPMIAVDAPAPVTAAPAAPRPAPPRPAPGADGKMQCPKCGLFETQRGSVIGWYCKVCGWREAKR